MVEEGQPAPNFEARDGSGATVRLADLRGRPVVLYFYPKDDTPGCTKEACGFRDEYAALQATGAALLGVSPDDEESHRQFAAKFDLPFQLLADPGAAIATAYGVWKEKNMYGRTYMGVERTTFLLDEAGVIRKIFPKVKVDGHVGEVLAALQGSGAG
jgi:thioredoxin-dependent peroxiredoxin